jgi:WD40 repeat protein
VGSQYLNPGPVHGDQVLALAFSADGKTLFSAGADSTTRLAKAESGKEFMVLHSGDWAEDIDVSPDGTWAVTASDDKRVWVWNLQTGQPKMRLNNANFVFKAKISPDGQWIASTGSDHTVRVWDAQSGSQMLQGSLSDIGSSLQFARDGKSVVVGDRSGNITVWDITGLAARVGYVTFPEFAREVRLFPDNKTLLVNTDDRAIWMLGVDTPLQQHTTAAVTKLFTADGLTYNTDISPDSNWVALAESQENKAILYNIKDKKTTILKHTNVVTGVAFSADGSLLAVSDKSGKVILWDVQTGENKSELVTKSAALNVDFKPNNTEVAAGLDGRADTIVWKLPAQTPLAELAQAGDVSSILFSADGEWLATGDNFGTIKIWNGNDFSLTQTIQLNGSILNMAFSPDRRWLAVGTADNYALLIDAASGVEAARIPHVSGVTGISFSPDGKQLFTVAGKVLQVWEIAKLDQLSTTKLVETACSRLDANMSLTVWQTIFGNDEYKLICPNLPQGKD